MAKILLVEDDNNLREIYEARLQAEGYQIARAKDGEEALVVAKKERPDLIIADVMMPRVSGFEMLDIIRNTPELKEVHVIMLTALGQAEDKTRADSLGADRYLVKSQVTLEDIVKAAADVLSGAPAGPAPSLTPAGPAGPVAAAPAAVPAPTPEPVESALAAAAPPAAPAEPPVAASVPPIAEPVTPASTPIAPPIDTSAPGGLSIPVTTPPTTPPADSAVPPPTDAGPTAPTDVSATDSQLVANAVNDLIAGTNGAAPADPTPPTASPAPPTAPVLPTDPVGPTPPAAPQPQRTMEPVLPPAAAAPPPAPAPIAPPTDGPTIAENPATARKAITPLPPGSSPSQPDLNELLAREGHDLGDADAPDFANTTHTPGNVISPGNAAPSPLNNPPAPPPTNNSAPADPNSISL